MKKARNRALALLKLALIGFGLVACNEHKPVPAPDVKINPAPKKIYEITFTMDEVPSSLLKFPGEVQYEIENRSQCIPIDLTRSLGGSRPIFTKEMAIEFQRSEDNKFKSQLVDDTFLNEDYYGLGVCKWKAAGISTKLERPHSEMVRLSVATEGFLRSGDVEERYCLKPEHVRTDLLGLCAGEVGMKSRKEPREWYYKVTVEGTRVHHVIRD